MNSVGFSIFYIEIKQFPSNVQGIRFSQEIICETLMVKGKYIKYWRRKNASGILICRKSDYQYVNYIDICFKMDILGIE